MTIIKPKGTTEEVCYFILFILFVRSVESTNESTGGEWYDSFDPTPDPDPDGKNIKDADTFVLLSDQNINFTE